MFYHNQNQNQYYSLVAKKEAQKVVPNFSSTFIQPLKFCSNKNIFADAHLHSLCMYVFINLALLIVQFSFLHEIQEKQGILKMLGSYLMPLLNEVHLLLNQKSNLMCYTCDVF